MLLNCYIVESLNRGCGEKISAARMIFSDSTIQRFNDSTKAFRAK